MSKWGRFAARLGALAVPDQALRRAEDGFPTSPNAASSLHLIWWFGEGVPELMAAEATLEVLIPPVVDHLYFWALQVGFVGPEGPTGAAHLGLQWHPGHPEGRAVNWGGYDQGGSVLIGTGSELPSTLDNPNTRDFPWQSGHAYRLRVSPTPERVGWWQGEVTELATGATIKVRDLAGGGDRLSNPMVWSEVFARCQDPSVAVRWSDPAGFDRFGAGHWPGGARVNYQGDEAGGCSNTNSISTAGGIVQITNTERITRQEGIIPWR